MPAGLGRAEKFNGLPSRKRNKIGLFALRLANERHLARRAHCRASSCRGKVLDFLAAGRVQHAGHGCDQVQWAVASGFCAYHAGGVIRRVACPRKAHSRGGPSAAGLFPAGPSRRAALCTLAAVAPTRTRQGSRIHASTGYQSPSGRCALQAPVQAAPMGGF
jgi:hypothetical protein